MHRGRHISFEHLQHCTTELMCRQELKQKYHINITVMFQSITTSDLLLYHNIQSLIVLHVHTQYIISHTIPLSCCHYQTAVTV